jgi:hypothetical protein
LQDVPPPVVVTVAGNALTENAPVLPLPGVLLQVVVLFWIDVIVNVVVPAADKDADGTENEPVFAAIVNEAVAPVTLFAPLRLYVAV